MMLTETIKDYIDRSALRRLATADNNGSPDVSAKEMLPTTVITKSLLLN